MNFEEKRKKVVKKVQRKTWFKCLKEQFLISHEKGIVPVICALLMLIPLGIVLYTSYKKNTDEISYILAMISLFTSVSFELYEWFYLFGKRDVSKKVLTFPCIIDFVLLMVFSIIYSVYGFNISNKNINIICVMTLLGYLILVTIRGVIELNCTPCQGHFEFV